MRVLGAASETGPHVGSEDGQGRVNPGGKEPRRGAAPTHMALRRSHTALVGEPQIRAPQGSAPVTFHAEGGSERVGFSLLI